MSWLSRSLQGRNTVDIGLNKKWRNWHINCKVFHLFCEKCSSLFKLLCEFISGNTTLFEQTPLGGGLKTQPTLAECCPESVANYPGCFCVFVPKDADNAGGEKCITQKVFVSFVLPHFTAVNLFLKGTLKGKGPLKEI